MSFFFNDSSAASRMLALIERCAPRMMRCGGGGITQYKPVYQHAAHRRFTEAEKARIASFITSERTQGEIAALAGCAINTARRMAQKMGVTLKNGRRGVAVGTKRTKRVAIGGAA